MKCLPNQRRQNNCGSQSKDTKCISLVLTSFYNLTSIWTYIFQSLFWILILSEQTTGESFMGFGSQKGNRSHYVLKASHQRVPGSIAIHTQWCKIYWITFLPSAGHSCPQGYRLWWRQLPVQHLSLFTPSFPPASLPNGQSHWPAGPPPEKEWQPSIDSFPKSQMVCSHLPAIYPIFPLTLSVSPSQIKPKQIYSLYTLTIFISHSCIHTLLSSKRIIILFYSNTFP